MGPGKVDGVPERVAGAVAGGVVARPGLFGRLGGPARVTVVAAPAGSGKTVLLRSWISQAGLSGRAAWVPAGRDERDPQHFWLAMLGALRRTAPGSALVRPLTAPPDMDGSAITERLLADLAPLAGRVWLVVDDVHELGPEVLRQLELLIMRAPPELRFVLAARHDVRLGLHRLRLEGELAEIRADDLGFSLAEAAQLFAAAGVELPAATVAVLHERTEGWAAGLRLAALSLAGHPDPGRFAAEFSGSERTVAEYLLAEVLDRQPEPVRRLLLRTSILERVNGQLADLLTADQGGERVLQDLQAANAFTVALDASRTWFRYHQMFAGLLRLELRRAAPGEVAPLHGVAAGWFAGHGYPAEAIRHAQAAGDWELAGRLLAFHWFYLLNDAKIATTHELLAGFPAEVQAADPALTALMVADELVQGSLETAERHLVLAERQAARVPDSRRVQFQVLLGNARLLIARSRGHLPAAAAEARRLQALAETPEAAELGLSREMVSAGALQVLGRIEVWASRFEEAQRDLERSAALARQAGLPYWEYAALAHLAVADMGQSFARAAEHARQAMDLAERHGWPDEQCDGVAYAVLADMLVWQGRPEEAEPWIQRAERSERTMTAEAEPAATLAVLCVRGRLELAFGRDADALAAFEAAGRRAGHLPAPRLLVTQIRAWLLCALVRLGDTERAEQALAGLSDHDRDSPQTRIAVAALRLAEGNADAAAAALALVLGGSAAGISWMWLAHAFVLEAIARDALGDQIAAESALERALDLAEPNGAVLPFLLYPAPGLLERQARHRSAHAALIAEILGLLAGSKPAPPPAAPRLPVEPLTTSELRLLRYLPTNLTGPEIADELYVSANTIKTHLRTLYAKLGTHHRSETVARARDLGLLAPSARSAR
ncbi:MAG TPA: LuxR C-terminal-related transcriptional regulator [Trebonia sp.]